MPRSARRSRSSPISSSRAVRRSASSGSASADVTVEELRARYDGCKPCLHGSDSHDQESVGQPVDNRFSWIKGALEFDALRQACIDPEGRAYVGEQPPRSAMPSQVISHVRIDNADWATTPDIPLNPGLVAIIGARGSGKTALADVIAAGCDAISPSGWDADENISPSFLARARTLDRRRDDDADLGRRRDGHALTRRQRRQRSHVVSARPLSLPAVRRGALLGEGRLGWPRRRDRARDLRVAFAGRSRRGNRFRRAAGPADLTVPAGARARSRGDLRHLGPHRHRVRERKPRRDADHAGRAEEEADRGLHRRPRQARRQGHRSAGGPTHPAQ